MRVVIWHNPRCSKSRAALAILQDRPGLTIEIVDYQKTPPERAAIAAMLGKAGLSPRQALRTGEPIAKAQHLATADDPTILDAMAAHPILIERPLVATDRGVRLGRPPEAIIDIL
jgi:arsenate reductase